MNTAYQIRSTLRHSVKPEQDQAYLKFIRDQPCIVCGSKRRSEASHFGPAGLGQKSDDRQTLPLCHKHHRTGADSYHKLGPRGFADRHRLQIEALILDFQSLYKKQFPNSKPIDRVRLKPADLTREA